MKSFRMWLIFVICCMFAIALYIHKPSPQHPIASNPEATGSITIESEPIPPMPLQIGLLAGKVVLSPTCPVESASANQQCTAKPYPGVIDIMEGNKFVEIHANVNGGFYSPLPVGTYTVEVHVTTLYPRCETKQAVIVAHATTTLMIVCDSGIR